MEDVQYQTEKLRNVGANFMLLVALIFLVGGLLVDYGMFQIPIIRYGVFAGGVLLFIAGVMIRFQRTPRDTDFA